MPVLSSSWSNYLLAVSGMTVLLFLAPEMVAESEESVAYVEQEIRESDRDHWAYRPISDVDLPEVEDVSWVRNPIDQFVLARLERQRLHPMPEASRGTQLRRLAFDLNGLPPSEVQLREFQNDEAVNAYERLVDRLLDSSTYGERWAQHWLDLARYAETDGFENDHMRANAWKYRDWVIRSLNSDVGYDQFVKRQLAGDLLPGGRHAIATYFCLAGPDMPDVNSQIERRHHVLNDVASTVGSVLLGVQLGCAQCHDHKYDPISLGDFYRLRAFFQPAVQVKKNHSTSCMLNESSGDETFHLMIHGSWNRPGTVVEPAFPRIANPMGITCSDDQSKRIALADWFMDPDHPLTARVMVNRLWYFHFGNGLCRTPSDFGVVSDHPTHPELLDWLAKELMDSGWSLKHVHRLIVTSATYRQAGRTGDVSNPGQRDAAWNGLLVSRYQQIDNAWLSRFPRRRLEGELIRDAMLAAAGIMNRSMYGMSVRPPLSDELTSTLLEGHWEVSSNVADHQRRSVYVLARRNLRYPIFDAFDRPDANSSCPRRSRTTTAPQSLMLLNSQFSLQMARRTAGRLLMTAVLPEDLVRRAFVVMLGRIPEAVELQWSLEFLATQQRLASSEWVDGKQPIPAPDVSTDPRLAQAVVDLCLAIFNTNEFVYVD